MLAQGVRKLRRWVKFLIYKDKALSRLLDPNIYERLRRTFTLLGLGVNGLKFPALCIKRTRGYRSLIGGAGGE